MYSIISTKRSGYYFSKALMLLVLAFASLDNATAGRSLLQFVLSYGDAVRAGAAPIVHIPGSGVTTSVGSCCRNPSYRYIPNP